MPRIRSYHEPHRTITVQYTHSRLSRWGFFPVILEYLDRLHLPQRLAAVTIPPLPTPTSSPPTS